MEVCTPVERDREREMRQSLKVLSILGGSSVLLYILLYSIEPTAQEQEGTKALWVSDQYRNHCPSCAWLADNGFESGCSSAPDGIKTKCIAAIQECNRCADTFIAV